MVVREEVIKRLNLGISKYGHGVRVMDDTVTWGTKKNSWLEMASEELLDAIVYVIADYLRTVEQMYDEDAKDDNDLIMHIFDNPKTVRSEKHCSLLEGLINMTQICL
jgi:hypothetical protein|tara:strand:+ start:49 stop:369 length:321 start_codon:yes stop_codon:yes gene_type:complete